MLYCPRSKAMSYLDLPERDIVTLSGPLDILFITATEVETESLHNRLAPLPGKSSLIRIFQGSHTYFIGTLGAYAIVHVQCGGMGSLGRESAITTTLDAIDAWHPKAVIMVGIAFGVDKADQNIGDVLVSEVILPYDNKKIGEEKTTYRGPRPQAGQILLNRFKNSKGWKHATEEGDAKCIFGHLLSGETLLDQLVARDELLKVFPTAKGGEMEGAGVYAAADTRKVEWLLVKGICDFADGNKGENKEQFQKVAAKSAVSLCEFIFASEYVFDALGIKSIGASRSVVDRDQIVTKVLFPLYTTESEKYYQPREIDDQVQNTLKLLGIWLSGPCGSGKTNMILRNLYIAGFEFIFFDLSVCTGKKGLAFLRNFYSVVRHRITDDGFVEAGIDTMALIEGMAELMSNKFKDKKMVLYFDELPISGEADFEEFIEIILAVLIRTHNRNPNTQTRFIFSTIMEPRQLIKPHQQKIYEKIQFIHLPVWDVDDQVALFNLIARELGFAFEAEDRNSILDAGNATPRYIKNFFKNQILMPQWPLARVIAETQREVANG
jgi:nucleoside phosphorylase